MRHVILVDVIQTLCVSTIGAASPWNRKCNTFGTRECRSLTESVDTRQSRRQNRSCGTRAAERLTLRGTIIGTIPAEGLQSASWRSVASRSAHLFAEDRSLRVHFCECLHLHLAHEVSFHKIMRTDEACFTREVVINVHNSHLWERDNPRAIRECGYQFHFSISIWAGIVRAVSSAPTWYLGGWLLSDVVIFRKLFYSGCLKMCLQLWGRDCMKNAVFWGVAPWKPQILQRLYGFRSMELQRGMGKVCGCGWTRYILELFHGMFQDVPSAVRQRLYGYDFCMLWFCLFIICWFQSIVIWLSSLVSTVYFITTTYKTQHFSQIQGIQTRRKRNHMV
jgi:hypothetical protein